MKLLALLPTKALVTIVAGVLLVGGATAAFAATPAGQTVVQSLTHTHPTTTAAATHGAQAQGTSAHGQKTCAGLADAQNLATSFHLSTASTGAAITAICALHAGTFRSMTSAGVKVAADRVYGYGEIRQLLTYAQYLATHNSANAGGTLSDTTVDSFLADALHSCAAMPLERCLMKNIPGFTPGQNGSMTPTPNGKRPTMTPTPNGNRPTGTPTPHH
ncbi:MAG TPA: hypothetical protein VGF67_18635 [Ktedonobacteraceae bacterium]|jgi:hypothetical protein